MKKNYLLKEMAIGISFLFLFSTALFAQTDITVGTSTITNKHLPIEPYYGYTYSQQIYLASEIGTSGTITHLKFNFAGTSLSSSNNWTIYIGTTSNTSFASSTSWIPVSNLTQVYSSTFASPTAAGWLDFDITDFSYNGADNIVVAVDENVNGYNGGSDDFYCTQKTAGRSIYYFSDYTNPNPSSPPTGILTDFISNIKFTVVPVSNDLTMAAWVSPSPSAIVLPNASVPITVTIKNYGTTTQSGFPVKYSIDAGTTIVTETCSSSIAAGASLNYTFTTTANMATEGVYECGAVVSLSGDVFPANDTAFAMVNVFNPLAGPYTVGAAASNDYTTIMDAVNDLYLMGISAPVIFNIAAGTYNEQVELDGAIIGSSPINTITFKGQGISTIVTAVTTNSDRDIFRFNHTSYIILDSLSLVPTSSYYNCGVRIMESDSITIKNTTISLPINTTSYTNGILVSGSEVNSYTATISNYLVFDNNIINGGYYGIRLSGNSSNHSSNISIKNNTINDFHYYGIYSFYQDFIDIEDNLITSNPYTSGYGIYLNNNLSLKKIANNKIIMNTTSGGYGLYLSSSQGASAASPMMVYNNMISIPTATGACIGLYSTNSVNVSFYYNSINIEKGASNSRAAYIAGNLYSTIIKDNIFFNKGAGYAVYLSYTSGYSPSVCDYNDLVSNGNNLAYNSSDIVDLTAWQSSVNNPGVHSVSIGPGFLSATDLHASTYILKSKGSSTYMIPYDIDGDIRSVSAPDMGADEFVPNANDVQLSEIITAGSCGLSTTEYIQVVVKNYGSAAQINVPIKLIVDGGAVITETISTLAIYAVDTFTFATAVDLSAAGYHSIMAYADLTTDANHNNDTVYYDLDNILAISSFPYLQDFESTVYDFSINFGANANAKLSARAANGGTYGLILTGKTTSGWINNVPTLEQAFQDNYTHIAEVYACNVDASSLSYLSLDFDMKINATFKTSYAWLRVIINDSIYVKDIYGDSAWQAPTTGNTMAFKNLAFHLNEYAGTHFKLSFEASCKYDSINYTSNPWGDEVMIDNIHLYEPLANDLSVTVLVNPISGICESSNASTQVVVENKGALSQNNVPITAIITTPTGDVTITANSGLIPAFSFDTITLGNVDISQFAVYDVVSYASFTADQDHSNDTLHTSFEIYSPFAVDYIENFDSSPLYWGAGPSGWYIGNPHGKTGKGLYKQFNSSNTDGYAYMRRKIGPIPAEAVLTFDYRILDYYSFPYSPTILDGDSVLFQVSTDCGSSYNRLYVVDTISHITSLEWRHIQVDMSAYVGQNVIIREEVIYHSGNYYVDVDNFGIAVPPALDLGPDTAICIGVPITLDAGSATSAYPYIWTYGLGSSADTIAFTQTISPDSAGIYVVKIRDVKLENYDTIVITTNPLPTVSGPNYDTICYNDSSLVEFTFTGAAPWDFTISVNGSSFNDNSSIALTQRYVSPSTTTLYTVISITDGNGCNSTGSLDSMEVFVNPLPTVSFSTTLPDLCADDPAYSLTGGLPTNGVYTGSGVSTGIFSATSAGGGSHIITYTYTDANGCSDSATQTQLVNALPVVSLATLSDLCADAADFTLSGGTPTNGTYSGTGVSGGAFSANTAGAGSHAVTYSYTDANGCSDSATQTQVVNALPIVSFATLADVCANNSDFTLSGGTPINGAYSGTGVSAGTFSPTTAGVGSYTLTYAYTDANGCSDNASQAQVVNSVPTVTFTTTLADLCADAPSYTLSGGLPINGTYSGTGVSSGSFVATTAGVGSHTVTYTFSDANGCSDSATQSQLVNALPTVSMTALPSLCADAADFTLSGGAPANGTYSGTGVSGGIFSAATSGAGSYYVTYSFTDANSCTNFDSVAQVVNALPVVSFTGLAPTYCTNSLDDTLIANIMGGIFAGTGMSADVFSASTAGAGSFDITYSYTDGNGCNSSDTNSTVVYNAPQVDLGSDTTLCVIDSLLLNAGVSMTSYAWSTGASSQSIYADSSDFGVGAFTYAVLITDANNCSNTDSVDITFEALPLSQLFDTSSICGEGASLTLDAGANPLYGYLWSTGAVTNDIVVDTTIIGGTSNYVFVTLTSPAGCTTNDSSYVYFREVPMPFIGNDSTICWNHQFVLDAGAGYASYLWNTGATTQTIVLDSLSFILGSNDYSVEVVNAVNCANSDTMTLVVDPCTGIYVQELTYEEIRVYPNPSKGRFQIDITGLEKEDYSIEIFNSMGSKVAGKNLDSNGKSSQSWDVDLSTYAKGIYFVRLQSVGKIKVKRIIIQ